jgi:cytochrome c oxidase cbb3-type subunit III
MNPDPRSQPPSDHEDDLRPHSFDGIQEYDKRLPNWWLNTLYATIAFSVVYWFVYQTARVMPTDGAQVDAEMAGIAATKLASSLDVTNDKVFWEMSANAAFVESGKQIYNSNCIACHLPSLRGKSENPGAIGPDLSDQAWIHGGTPKEIYVTVAKGVPAKGMLAWEPILGQKKTAEVVAYILSYHKQGEPITVEGAK